MADQSFQQAMGVIRVTLQLGQMVTTTLEMVLNKLLEEGNLVEEELRKAYKDGKALTVEVSPKDEEQLARIMAENGFGRDKMHPMQKCIVEQPDGTQKTLFLIMKKDEDLAKNCIAELNKEKSIGGMISKEDMVRYAGRDTMSIEMSSTDAVAMVRRAEQYGLKVAGAGPYTDKNGQEKFKMFFAEKDRKLLNRVQLETMCDLEGKAGAIYRTMLERESAYKVQAISAMITGRGEDKENLRNGTMLVNAQGTTLEIKGANLILTQLDGQRDVFKRADMKKDYVRARIEQHFAYDKTALLSPEQAQQYRNAQSLESKEKVMMMARNQPTGGLEPIAILSPQDVELLKRHEAERDLINQKLQEENPAYKYAASPVYDNSPITQFVEEQNRNADLTHDVGQRGLPVDERILMDDARAEDMGDLFTEPMIEEVPDATIEKIFEPERQVGRRDTQEYNNALSEQLDAANAADDFGGRD